MIANGSATTRVWLEAAEARVKTRGHAGASSFQPNFLITWDGLQWNFLCLALFFFEELREGF